MLSNKGGTGKTAIAIGIAKALAKRDDTLLLDLDMHGPDVLCRLHVDASMVDFTREKVPPLPVAPGLWAFSADSFGQSTIGYMARDEDKRAFVKSSFSQLEMKGIRYIVCDMPAGTDEVLFTMMKQIKPRGLIIVTNPERSTVLDTQKLISILEHYGYKRHVLGVIENMAYVQGPKGHRGHRFNEAYVVGEICEPYELEYLGEIPELVSWTGFPSTEDLYNHPIFENIAERLV